jgi:hypothetical protein
MINKRDGLVVELLEPITSYLEIVVIDSDDSEQFPIPDRTQCRDSSLMTNPIQQQSGRFGQNVS